MGNKPPKPLPKEEVIIRDLTKKHDLDKENQEKLRKAQEELQQQYTAEHTELTNSLQKLAKNDEKILRGIVLICLIYVIVIHLFYHFSRHGNAASVSEASCKSSSMVDDYKVNFSEKVVQHEESSNNIVIFNIELFKATLEMAQDSSVIEAWDYARNVDINISQVTILNFLFLKMMPNISFGIAIVALGSVLSFVCSYLVLYVCKETFFPPATMTMSLAFITFGRHLFFAENNPDREVLQVMAGVHLLHGWAYGVLWIIGFSEQFLPHASRTKLSKDTTHYHRAEYISLLCLQTILAVIVYNFVPFAPFLMVLSIIVLELLHNAFLGLGIFDKRDSVIMTVQSCVLKIVFGIGCIGIWYLSMNLQNAGLNKSFPIITDPATNLNWIGITIAMLASLDLVFYPFGKDPLLNNGKIIMHIIYLLIYYSMIIYGLRSKNTTLYSVSSIVIAIFSQMHPIVMCKEKIISGDMAIAMALGSSFLFTILIGRMEHEAAQHVGFVHENIMYFISGPGIFFVSSQVAIHFYDVPIPFITFVINCFTIYMAVIMNRSSLLVTSLLTIAR